MRLEEDAQPAAGIPLARRGDRRGDLGRMVAVVVDDRQAVELVHLEPPTRACEARDHSGRFVAGDTGELESRERAASVATVSSPGRASAPSYAGASRTT